MFVTIMKELRLSISATLNLCGERISISHRGAAEDAE